MRVFFKDQEGPGARFVKVGDNDIIMVHKFIHSPLTWKWLLPKSAVKQIQTTMVHGLYGDNGNSDS